MVCAGESGRVAFMDAKSGDVKRVVGRRCAVWAVAFSPGGEVLAVGGDEDVVATYDAASGAKDNELARSSGPNLAADVPPSKFCRCLSFSQDGETLASGGLDGRVVLYAVPAFTERLAVRRGGFVYSVCFSPDSQTLCVAGGDKRLALYTRRAYHRAPLVYALQLASKRTRSDAARDTRRSSPLRESGRRPQVRRGVGREHPPGARVGAAALRGVFARRRRHRRGRGRRYFKSGNRTRRS